MDAANSQIGEMMDFLKAYPSITMEQYLWELSLPMIRLMSYDATQVIYLTEEQKKKYKNRRSAKSEEATDDPDAFAKALGIPTF